MPLRGERGGARTKTGGGMDTNLAAMNPAHGRDAVSESESPGVRGWLRLLLEWSFRPRQAGAPEVSEILEAHRMAWRRIEIRRQEFAPPDMAVAQRIMSGYGRTSKNYYGYEKKSHRALFQARL